jgi:hypothetical protein
MEPPFLCVRILRLFVLWTQTSMLTTEYGEAIIFNVNPTTLNPGHLYFLTGTKMIRLSITGQYDVLVEIIFIT